LINTVILLLETHLAENISVDRVVKESGISNGSLYHHFSDLQDLIDHALVARFAGYVDNSVAIISQVTQEINSKEELVVALRKITRATQGRELINIRSMRVWTLGQTTVRPSFKKLLGQEQERLTKALAELIRFAQEKGWFRAELDPLVIGVFIQSYTIGKYVDDIAINHMNDDKWDSLIDSVVETLFIKN
jgi:AcrR family transcriptional regulator